MCYQENMFTKILCCGVFGREGTCSCDQQTLFFFIKRIIE